MEISNPFSPFEIMAYESLGICEEGESAKLILVEGVKGGGVEMEVERPLYIYDDTGDYTEEIEAMYE